MVRLSYPSLAALLGATLLHPLTAQQYGGAFELHSASYNASSSDYHGVACAAVGDLNADSIGDFAVGAPGHDGTSLTNSGAVRIYSGADGSLIDTIEGTASYELMGVAVLGIPDIDSDSVPDLAVASRAGAGTVTLWSGASRTLIDTLSTPADAHDFGGALARIGDLNSNGFDELLIGAENSKVGGVAVGAVYIVDLSTRAVIQSVNGGSFGDAFGSAVASIADCNTDGLPDYLVAAPGADPGGVTNAGSVFLLSGADGSTLLQLDGSRPGLFYGDAVAGLDDIDGDGTPDFAIGTIRDYPLGSPGLFIGSAAIVSGADGSEIRRHWGQDTHERFGGALCGLDDLDGDGKREYLVGAPGDLLGGRVYAFYSSYDSLMTIMESDGPDDAFGSALANLGDHDGDGHVALVATAPFADAGAVNGGGAYLREFSPGMTATGNAVSVAAGGTIDYLIDFPADITYTTNQTYQMLVSTTGVGPTEFYGILVPLTDDTQFQRTSSKTYPGPLANSFGTLAVDGTATCTATFPAGTLNNLVGRTVYLSCVWYEQGGGGFVMRGSARSEPLTFNP